MRKKRGKKKQRNLCYILYLHSLVFSHILKMVPGHTHAFNWFAALFWLCLCQEAGFFFGLHMLLFFTIWIVGLGLASMLLNMVGGIMLFIDTSENTVYVQDATAGPPPGCCNTGMQ